jgi:hypothetical protein
MREIRSYGSVRGVAGNRYPYRDQIQAYRPSPRLPDPRARAASTRTRRIIWAEMAKKWARSCQRTPVTSTRRRKASLTGRLLVGCSPASPAACRARPCGAVLRKPAASIARARRRRACQNQLASSYSGSVW